MRVVVAGGKGGVGKSMVAAMLYEYLGNAYGVDCDVEAPNLHLWLGIEERGRKELYLGKRPVIDMEKCIRCNRCGEVCPFGAIENGMLNPWFCEGCGACERVCPVGAIRMEPVLTGYLVWGEGAVWGELVPGQKGSGKIVEVIKEWGRGKGEVEIRDAAAGIGCPVIASVKDSDVGVLVTEPTPSAISDLSRISRVLDHFGIPYVVVVNRADLNRERAEEVKGRWRVVGEMEEREEVYEYLARGRPPLDLFRDVVEGIWEGIKETKEEYSSR